MSDQNVVFAEDIQRTQAGKDSSRKNGYKLLCMQRQGGDRRLTGIYQRVRAGVDGRDGALRRVATAKRQKKLPSCANKDTQKQSERVENKRTAMRE